MKLHLLIHQNNTFMATPYLRSVTRAFASSSAFKWEGGVSMVQGASRGIGLEFKILVPFMLRMANPHKAWPDNRPGGGPKRKRPHQPNSNDCGVYICKYMDALSCGLNFIAVEWTHDNAQVKQLLENNEKGHVIATCRNPNGATGLLELKNKFSERLDIQRLDVTNERTIEESAKSISERYGSLNLLINASGVLSIPNVTQPETTLNKVQKSSLMLAYEINAVGPILVIKHMWPLLKSGGGSGTEREVAVVASLSARVGSIGDNRLGGWHSYRASKTALNQLTKNISVEFARKKDPIVCLLLHPGTVDTDLSKPFQKNVPEGKLFTKEFSVQKLLSIINNARIHDNGKFFSWDGQEIPW